MKTLITLSLLLFALGACSKADKMDRALDTSNSDPTAGEPGSDDPSGDDSSGADPQGSGDSGSETRKPSLAETRAKKEVVYWAHRTANAMTSFYDRDHGLWLNGDAWENPHAFIAFVDFMQLSNNRYHTYLVANEGMGYLAKNPNLASDSYQNTAWWALALIRTYDLLGDAVYLSTAVTLGDYLIANAWDDKTCGGGMWKDKAHSYLDASSTEVYIKVMAALHNRIASDKKYLDQALKAWNWFEKGPFNENGLIANYIQGSGGTCAPEPSKSYYAHNQGVILGAAAELYNATLDPVYIQKGLAFADKSMAILSKDGIFHDFREEACDKCTGGGSTYKGIYVRYLRELADVAQSEKLYSLLDKTAEKAWNGARSSQDLIGYHWGAAFDIGDLQRQIAALDLFNSQIVKPDPTNIALKAAVTSSTQCVEHHNPGDIVDGNGIAKWCANVGNPAPWIQMDLGAEKDFSQIKMINCGGGTEPLAWNTKDFTFSVASNPNGPFTDVAVVKGNEASFWNQKVKAKGRYLKLTIQNGGDGVARINEIIVEK